MGKPMYKWYQVYLTIVLNPNPKSEPLSTSQNLRWKVVSYILQLNSFSEVSPHHRQAPRAGQHAVKGVTSQRRPKFLGEGAVTVTHMCTSSTPPNPTLGLQAVPVLRGAATSLRCCTHSALKVSCLVYGSWD